MNKQTAEIITQAKNLIELEGYMKKMKFKPEQQENADKVYEYIKYEIYRCVADLVVTEKL